MPAQRLAPAFQFLVDTGRYRCRAIDDAGGRRADLLYSSDQVSISVVRDRAGVFVSLAPRHQPAAAYLEADLLARVARGEPDFAPGAPAWPFGPPEAVAARLREALPAFERLLAPERAGETAARVARLQAQRAALRRRAWGARAT